MLGFSFEQLAVLAVVCILVLGPQKSLELAHFLGRAIGNLKNKWDEYRRQIELPNTGKASKIAQDLKAEFSSINFNTSIENVLHSGTSNHETLQDVTSCKVDKKTDLVEAPTLSLAELNMQLCNMQEELERMQKELAELKAQMNVRAEQSYRC